MPITAEQLRMVMSSASSDEEFKTRLHTSSTNFIDVFQEWIETKALEIAHKGKRSANCKYPLSFNERFAGFRISTYVKGFRKADGGFDSSRFQELDGYDEEVSTPFVRACKLLGERGIVVQDISNPSRGLGFWLSISF